MSQALDGIRVLEFTTFLSGPYCSMLLGDMGAEVIKVERPGRGDDMRWIPPFVEGESVSFLAYNRNKKAITLDVRCDQGRELFKELAKRADILVENHRPGVMASLGLGYEVLSEQNPRIILTSISGYGQSGPYRDRPGLDLIAQAMGGLMSLTGEPGGRPVRAGNPIGDILGALYAVYGTLAALYHRETTGLGQWVDAAMMEGVAMTCGSYLVKYAMLGQVETRTGNTQSNQAPWNMYYTADGYVVMAVASDSLWMRCMEAIGRRELASDPRFATVAQRIDHRALVDQVIADWTKSKTTTEAVNILNRAGVPCGPVLSIDEMVHDQQFAARDMLIEINHPKIQALKLGGITPKLSQTPGLARNAPPLIGQHNQDIYCGLLGYPEADLNAWQRQGVI